MSHGAKVNDTVIRRIDIYCLLLGFGEITAGLMLLLAPLWTLQLMGVPDLPSEPVYMRFIGAFVTGVGSAYLMPRLLSQAGRERRRRTVLEVTAGVRFVVGLFVLVAVLTGALGAAWWSVWLTDLGFAAFQLFLLQRFLGKDDGR